MNERSMAQQFTSPKCEEQFHGGTGGKLNPNLKFMIHYAVKWLLKEFSLNQSGG